MSVTVGEAGAKHTASSAAPQPLGMRKNGTRPGHLVRYHPWLLVLTCGSPLGKQWHAPKTAFRPGSGLTSYEKRAKERVALAAMKAKEKEMKDEKEAERQVRQELRSDQISRRTKLTDNGTETGNSNQGETRSQGGEGTI